MHRHCCQRKGVVSFKEISRVSRCLEKPIRQWFYEANKGPFRNGKDLVHSIHKLIYWENAMFLLEEAPPFTGPGGIEGSAHFKVPQGSY